MLRCSRKNHPGVWVSLHAQHNYDQLMNRGFVKSRFRILIRSAFHTSYDLIATGRPGMQNEEKQVPLHNLSFGTRA
jgi:hypothetical protein